MCSRFSSLTRCDRVQDLRSQRMFCLDIQRCHQPGFPFWLSVPSQYTPNRLRWCRPLGVFHLGATPMAGEGASSVSSRHEKKAAGAHQPRGPALRPRLIPVVGTAAPVELAKVEFPMVHADFVDPIVSEFEREPISSRFTVGADLLQGSLQKLAAA
jgi:hypothetical protein